MRYLQFFEKFGISKNLEDQCKSYFDKIKENPKKNTFNFVFSNDKGEYPFELKIGKFSGDYLGMHTIRHGSDEKSILKGGQVIINLRHRDDYSTLLHELKHLDYATRKENFHQDILHYGKSILSNLRKNDPLIYAQEIFYLLDKNEFESRYHGYYVDFDDFISKNISNNPNPGEIYDLFEKFISQTSDKSWIWYVKDDKFMFEDYFTKAQINRLFHQFIFITDFYKGQYDNIIREIISGAKKAFKATFNTYTKDELLDIERTKKIYEVQINKKLPKYRKKFFKLVSIMIDKWCK